MRLLLMIGLLVMSLGAFAAAAAPDAATPDLGGPVETTPVPKAPPRNPNLPTLFILGDSTVRNGAKGEQGWGDPLRTLFDLTKINVENHARGGRSSRTYRTEGLWKAVLDEAKPGDFVIMQFGHNDGGPLVDATRSRGSLKGNGDETKDVTKNDGSAETVHTFGWYMRQYAIEAKAKGMMPIICSWIPHCPRPEGDKPATMPTIPVTLDSYGLWAKQAADATGAEFVDLNGIIWTHYAAYTPEELKTKLFNPADYTHTSPAGAKLNAQCVVEGLLKGNSPLVKYLLPDNADAAAPQ